MPVFNILYNSILFATLMPRNISLEAEKGGEELGPLLLFNPHCPTLHEIWSYFNVPRTI
jgi:hypothetical protein